MCSLHFKSENGFTVKKTLVWPCYGCYSLFRVLELKHCWVWTLENISSEFRKVIKMQPNVKSNITFTKPLKWWRRYDKFYRVTDCICKVNLPTVVSCLVWQRASNSASGLRMAQSWAGVKGRACSFLWSTETSARLSGTTACSSPQLGLKNHRAAAFTFKKGQSGCF